MTKTITMDEQGTLTLPKEWRRRLMSGRGQVVAEETTEGILLRAHQYPPVEIYTEERLKEFYENNELALAEFIKKPQ